MPNILVIDDNLDALQLLGEMLKGCGHTAHPLSDGNLAVPMARSHRPDLILLDVSMPGMNGKLPKVFPPFTTAKLSGACWKISWATPVSFRPIPGKCASR